VTASAEGSEEAYSKLSIQTVCLYLAQLTGTECSKTVTGDNDDQDNVEDNPRNHQASPKRLERIFHSPHLTSHLACWPDSIKPNEAGIKSPHPTTQASPSSKSYTTIRPNRRSDRSQDGNI
jgi:hypothetical protein